MAVDDFFEHKQPAAELKHGILSRYPIIFAAKTGSSPGSDRVVFLDGYAGTGKYKDGKPGSPLLLARQAAALRHTRDVRGIFVDSKPEHVRSLERVLADWQGSFQYRIFEGELGGKLDEVLFLARGASLFAFLDPYGSAIGYDQLCAIMDRNKPLRRPPTELLLHFSLRAVYRRGPRRLAALTSDETKLGKVDRFLGGTEWRQIFLEQCRSQRPGLASIAVAEHFADKVKREQGFWCVPMPVFQSVQAETPEYLLLLFTRHREGIWQMANTMSLARKDWAEACSVFRLDAADQRTQLAPLEGLETYHGFDEKRYNSQVMNECLEPIMGNLWRLLDRGPIRIIDHVLEVYGSTLTRAGMPHVRRAVKELFKKQLVNDDGKGDDFYKRLIRRLR